MQDIENSSSWAIQHPKVDTMEQKVVSVLNPSSSSTSTSVLPEGTIAKKDISQGRSKKHPAPVEERVDSQIPQSTASSASHVPLSRAIKLSDRTSEMTPSVNRASMWGRTSVCILCLFYTIIFLNIRNLSTVTAGYIFII